MLTIRAVSDKPCFICGSKEKTAEVTFADKTFRGVLCMEHIYAKLKIEGKPHAPGPASRGAA